MLAAVVLGLLVMVAGTLAYTSWFGVIALAALSVWWSQADRVMEGQVLWTIGPTHAIVAADAAGIAGILVAVIRAALLLVGHLRD